jgi:hypothetical protein
MAGSSDLGGASSGDLVMIQPLKAVGRWRGPRMAGTSHQTAGAVRPGFRASIRFSATRPTCSATSWLAKLPLSPRPTATVPRPGPAQKKVCSGDAGQPDNDAVRSTQLSRTLTATTAIIAAAVTASPSVLAAPVEIFVSCEFSIDRPFPYDAGGTQYAGTRMHANNCHTNLPSAPVTLEAHFQIGYGDQNSGPTNIFRRDYEAPIDVTDGGSYTVQFPNNNDFIDLKPGSYMVSGTASSTIEGFVHPKHETTEIATWGVSWGSLPKM